MALYRTTAPTLNLPITVDDELSLSSINPVENRVVTKALNDKVSWEDNTILGAKNLFKNTATTTEINGITFTVNSDGTVPTSGTSGDTGDAPQLEMPVSLPIGSYKFSGCADGGSASTWEMFLWDDTTSSKVVADSAYDSSNAIEFDITAENIEHDITLNILVQNDVAIADEIVFKPMIRLASDTDNTFVSHAMTNRELTENMLSGYFSGNTLVLQYGVN